MPRHSLNSRFAALVCSNAVGRLRRFASRSRQASHSSWARILLGWIAAVSLVLLAAAASPLAAGTLYFSDAGGPLTWDDGTTALWSSASGGPYMSLWSSGADAVFEGTAGSVTVTGPIGSVNSIAFATDGYTLDAGAGGLITLTGAGGNISTGSGSDTINAAIGGAVGLTKLGSGTLILGNSANSYTGGTTVSAGTLQLNAAGAAGTGSITLGDAATGSSDIVLNINTAANITNAITVADQGTGAVTINLNAVSNPWSGGDWTLNRAVTLTAPHISGNLQFNPVLGGSGNLTLGNTNATRFIFNEASGANAGYTGDIDVLSGAVFEPRDTFASTTGNSVTIETGGEMELNFASASFNALNGGGIVDARFGGTQTLTVGKADGSGSFSGVLKDNGQPLAFTKTGAGVQTLTGSNTFTGATTVSAGTLRLGTGGSLGNTAISVAGGATFRAASGTFAGTTTTAGAGATLSLSSGATLDLTDATVGTFALNQNTSLGAAGLTLNGNTLDFDLGLAGSNRVAVLTDSGQGGASVVGTNTVNITPLGNSLANGSYNLITAAYGLTGSFQFANATTSEQLVLGATTYTLDLVNSDNAEQLMVSGGAPPLTAAVWKGALSNSWSTGGGGTASNWATDTTGATDTLQIPGPATDVTFSVGGGGANLNTVLGQDFAIKGLIFTSSADAAHQVTIGGPNSLAIGADGIVVDSGSARTPSAPAAWRSARIRRGSITRPIP